jgi:predicted AlkP superfamily pyrophosphatase or phosphodiesterase
MLLASIALGVATTNPLKAVPRPKFVVVISIDQYRADYLERFADNYLPPVAGGKVGGFRYLTERGANFYDAHYTHVPTATGPGHATILSGSVPALHGIVENEWFDRATNKTTYCVSDPTVQTVGGSSAPMSPRNLLTTTVGDELKQASAGKSKVCGISFKDRAAILLAGHAADTVLWFDTGNGAWVTSSFYTRTLPDWVQKWNAQERPTKELSQTWTPLLPDSAYANSRPAPFAKAESPVFSHPLAGRNFGNWTRSGQGQTYVFDAAKAMIENEHLGEGPATDLFVMNLATNDYVGHAFGPNSPEVEDIAVRTDRLLSDLFNFLDHKIQGGLKNVTIVVTADHGVVPIPEEAAKVYRLNAPRVFDTNVKEAVQKALAAQYGEGDWVSAISMPHLYLNRKLIAEKGLNLAQVQTAAARAAAGVEGIFSAFAASQIEGGRLPEWPWAQRVLNGFYPARAGDIVIQERPGAYVGLGNGTGHESPWAYDTHVPLLLSGFGVKPGKFGRTVGIPDIASTLCRILGVEQPTGNVGSPLYEALDR